MGILYKLKLFTVNAVAEETLRKRSKLPKVCCIFCCHLKQVIHIDFAVQRCVWAGQYVEKHYNTLFFSPLNEKCSPSLRIHVEYHTEMSTIVQQLLPWISHSVATVLVISSGTSIPSVEMDESSSLAHGCPFPVTNRWHHPVGELICSCHSLL